MGRNNNPQTKLRATLRIKTRVHPREEEEEEEDEKKKAPKTGKGGCGGGDGGDGDGGALPVWSVVSVHFPPGVVMVTVLLLLLLQILADTGSDRAG